MGSDACYEQSPQWHRHVESVRRLVYAHFRARGIPEARHSELWFRWVAQKGMRAPA